MRIKYPESNKVSIWVGTFASETDAENCVDHRIAPRLGLNVPITSLCEFDYHADVICVRNLLQGFSGWENFVDAAERAASAKGVEKANTALVCYYLNCENAPDSWEGMTFLGSFVGRDVQQ